MKTERRRFLAAAAALAAATATVGTRAAPGQVLLEVWKSPSCGCCKDWMRHMEANGFQVRAHDTGNTAMRQRMKIPLELGSCHTAVVGRYAIEGHVPARDVLRLIKERPDAIGLTVPGMPVGSPGMDGPEYGERRDPYDVLLVRADGSTSVFSSYR